MVVVILIVGYDFMILMTTFFGMIVIVIVFDYIDGKAALLFLLWL